MKEQSRGGLSWERRWAPSVVTTASPLLLVVVVVVVGGGGGEEEILPQLVSRPSSNAC